MPGWLRYLIIALFVILTLVGTAFVLQWLDHPNLPSPPAFDSP